MRTAISDNHYSHDQQVADALAYLEAFHPTAYTAVRADYPEEPIYDGSWLDREAMAVDPEYSSWLCNAIEATGLVLWEDGEPWADDGEQCPNCGHTGNFCWVDDCGGDR